MGFPGLINHLFNLVLPALVMAFAMPLLVRWTPLGRAGGGSMAQQMLVLAVVNMAVLVAGLWFFGRDGKMVTYFTMAVTCASCHWMLLKGWRA